MSWQTRPKSPPSLAPALRWCAASVAWVVLAACCAGAQENPPAENPPASQAMPPAAAPAAAPIAAAPPALIPAPLRPYRVQVAVSPPAGAAVEESILRELRTLLAGRFGGSWEVDVTATPGAGSLSPWELQNLSPEAATVRGTELGRDKLLLVAAEDQGSARQWSCREWDEASRSLSELSRTQALDPRDRAAALADSVCGAFRPVVRLESLTENRGVFQIDAGELPPRSQEQTYFQPGDLLVPCLRHLDRNLAVRRIQPLPWTWIRVDEVDRGRLKGTVISAFGAPIPAARRRVEVVALRVRPRLSETRVLVVPRRNAENPLVGLRCEVLDQLPTKEIPDPGKLQLATDRRGEVAVPADPQHPLRYLVIYSGAAVLARVPMIPGLSPREQLEAPDDRARLNVEGETQLLQGDLIDIVATREVLMARARQAAEKQNWTELDRFLAELAALPTLEQYQLEIDTLQVQAVYEARQLRDRVMEARINKLCAGVREAAGKHLDPFRLAEFRREMQEARRK